MTWRSKRPGPQERRVEDVGAVGGGDDDHVGVRVEAVHLDEDLVEGLLALVVRAAEAGAALAADRVDLVHEHDARAVALRLVEQVAHAAGADAHEHLDELGARDAEERHPGLARDGAGHQRLAGSRRAHQQHAARDARAERVELLGVLEELHDLLELRLRLVHAGDVRERHDGLVAEEHAGAALAEGHRLVVGALGLAHHEEDEAADHEQRQQAASAAGRSTTCRPSASARRRRRRASSPVGRRLLHVRVDVAGDVVRDDHRVGALPPLVTVERLAVLDDLRDLARLDVVVELRVAHRRWRASTTAPTCRAARPCPPRGRASRSRCAGTLRSNGAPPSPTDRRGRRGWGVLMTVTLATGSHLGRIRCTTA